MRCPHCLRGTIYWDEHREAACLNCARPLNPVGIPRSIKETLEGPKTRWRRHPRVQGVRV